MNQYSTIHVSKELSETGKDIMRISINEKDFPLSEKFLFTSYNKSSISMMDSIIKRHSVSISRYSCVQKNLSMISGKKHPLISRSLASPSISRKMTVLLSHFQYQK